MSCVCFMFVPVEFQNLRIRYCCTDTQCVKFVAKLLARPYPATLHEELQLKRLAPRLLEPIKQLAGGFTLMKMEFLDPASGWMKVRTQAG